MPKKQTHHPLPPLGKRMSRPARVQSARHWLSTFKGKNIVQGYRKRYGVDWPCAVYELQMLGVELDPAYVAHLQTTMVRQPIALHGHRPSTCASAPSAWGSQNVISMAR
jgi:hypothetical protein